MYTCILLFLLLLLVLCGAAAAAAAAAALAALAVLSALSALCVARTPAGYWPELMKSLGMYVLNTKRTRVGRFSQFNIMCFVALF